MDLLVKSSFKSQVSPDKQDEFEERIYPFYKEDETLD